MVPDSEWKNLEEKEKVRPQLLMHTAFARKRLTKEVEVYVRVKPTPPHINPDLHPLRIEGLKQVRETTNGLTCFVDITALYQLACNPMVQHVSFHFPQR